MNLTFRIRNVISISITVTNFGKLFILKQWGSGTKTENICSFKRKLSVKGHNEKTFSIKVKAFHC